MIKAKLVKFYSCSEGVSLEGKSKEFKNAQQLKSANEKSEALPLPLQHLFDGFLKKS